MAAYEANESTARDHLVAALVGGNCIGHARDTVPESVADGLWKRSRSPPGDVRFFLGVGLGDQAYAYQQGIVTVDNDKAGCFFVIDDD